MTNTPSLNNIAIDLTPILPQGSNGGAKIFTLELVEQLAQLAPKTTFTLLTHEHSHEELAYLERNNVQRRLVVKKSFKQTIRILLRRIARHSLPYLPKTVSDKIMTWGYQLNTKLKRHPSRSLLQQLSSDLLFCPFTAPTFAEPGVPTVCTIYDLQYKTYPDFFNAAERAHRHQAFTDACREATQLTAISDYSRESAIQHSGLSPDAIQTIHIRTAKRLLSFRADNQDILAQLHLTPQEYLLYPANFWPHKNHARLIDAFAQYTQENMTNVKLVCTGSPNTYQCQLVDTCKKKSLENIIFPGYLEDSALNTLMKYSRGVIFPSLYEGFGLPVIEAMAMSIPVACSTAGSLPEVADDGALFFDPNSSIDIAHAIGQLITNDDLRKALIEKGLSRATYFSDVTQMAQEYWAVFEKSSLEYIRK